MYVPEHITATGDALRYNDSANKRQNVRLSLIEQMEVPDRITVTGGDSYGRIMEDYNRGVAIPTECDNYLNDVPQVLTVAHTSYPEEELRKQVETARTDNSLVVDEDPLRELKIMRRSLGRINARMFVLEEENERRKSRETMLFVTLFGVAITAIWSLFKR